LRSGVWLGPRRGWAAVLGRWYSRLWRVGVRLSWGRAGRLLHVWCCLWGTGGRAGLVVRQLLLLLLLLLADVGGLRIRLLGCVRR